MTQYHNINTNETVTRLPRSWKYNNKTIMGLTESNMAKYGWEKIITQPPESQPPQLPEALISKERIFALKLKEIASKFNINLLELEDINIGTMLTAASDAGISETKISNASAILLALAKDVEAESNMNWTDTWLGLKSRLVSYMEDSDES